MSRIRFHAIREINKHSKVIWSGPGWENWNDSLPAKENIFSLYKDSKPDMVLCFRPQEIQGIAEIPFPSAVNRDEMFTEEIPAEKTVEKIVSNKIDLVISHQKKQLDHPFFKNLPCQFAFIPYCTDSTIFKDYGLEKTIDVLLIGNLGGARYPLRAHIHGYITRMLSDLDFQKYKIFVYPYPGYRLQEAYNDEHVIQFAKMINSSKICLTCSGKYHLKYAKYVEVPACRSLLMADMPCEDQQILHQYLAEISPDISYEDFCKKIRFFLEDKGEREKLTERGFQIVKDNYTQEHYAKAFLSLVENYLNEHGYKKVWN